MPNKSTKYTCITDLLVAYLARTNEPDHDINKSVSDFVCDAVEQICRGDLSDYNESIQRLRDVARPGSQTSLISSDDIAKILDRHHDSLNAVMEFLARREWSDSAYDWYSINVVERRDFSPHDPRCMDVNRDLLAFALLDSVACGLYQLALNDAQIK